MEYFRDTKEIENLNNSKNNFFDSEINTSDSKFAPIYEENEKNEVDSYYIDDFKIFNDEKNIDKNDSNTQLDLDISSFFKKNKDKIVLLKNDLSKEIINACYQDILNDESYKVEELFFDIEEKYGLDFLGSLVTAIYPTLNDKPEYILKVESALLIYDYQDIKTFANAFILGVLSNKDERVKAGAVELIENWYDKELLPVLNGIDVPSGWLKEYIERVKNSLK